MAKVYVNEDEWNWEDEPTTDELVDLYEHPRNCRCPNCEGQPEDWQS